MTDFRPAENGSYVMHGPAWAKKLREAFATAGVTAKVFSEPMSPAFAAALDSFEVQFASPADEARARRLLMEVAPERWPHTVPVAWERLLEVWPGRQWVRRWAVPHGQVPRVVELLGRGSS